MIDIDVPTQESEIVADYLWSHGVAGVEVIDTAEREHETLRTNVGDNPSTFLAGFRTTFPHLTVSLTLVDKAVSETWREFVSPTWVTDTLVIVPEWIESPPAPQVLRIEPRDTFGLGNHPTTVLALRLALTHISPRSTVFDLGTGSGVLAIGLSKFIGCVCTCFDIAPGSHDALMKNIELNSVKSVRWSSGYPDGNIDAVVANILAPVLIDEAESIQTHLKDGGVVVLSGMRDDQCENVISHFTECVEVARESRDGWTGVVLQKNL